MKIYYIYHKYHDEFKNSGKKLLVNKNFLYIYSIVFLTSFG